MSPGATARTATAAVGAAGSRAGAGHGAGVRRRWRGPGRVHAGPLARAAGVQEGQGGQAEREGGEQHPSGLLRRLHLTEGNGSWFKILFKDAAWPCNVFILPRRLQG